MLYTISIFYFSGKNIGFEVFKELKGEKEFNKIMEENNKVSAFSTI